MSAVFPPSSGPVRGWTPIMVLGTIVVTIGLAGLAIAVGATDRDRSLQLAGAALLIVAGAMGIRALGARTVPRRGLLLGGLVAASVGITVGAVVGTGPAGADERLLYTPGGGRTEVYFHAEPGGPEVSGIGAAAPMRTGVGHRFDCARVIDRAGTAETWIHSAEDSGWVPVTAVRTASGRVPNRFVRC